MKRVLSIQSAVTLGAVGNTLAQAVMATAGHQLCRVDTVQLTAHPGHGFRAGGSIDDTAFADLLDGLDRLEARFDGMMTGYIGTGGQIAPIAAALDRFRAAQEGQLVLVDPAFGDHGRLYVDAVIAEGIRDTLIARAGLITPNAFELGWLTGTNVTSPDDAKTAAALLFDQHPQLMTVAATGIPTDGGIADGIYQRDAAMVHEKPALADGRRGFAGGGDLFTAVTMAGVLGGLDLDQACARASRISALVFAETLRLGGDDIALAAIASVLAGDRQG